MENQIPAPSFPEQNNANSPQPVPAGVAPGAPLGAAPAPAPTARPPATSAAPATSTPSVRSVPPWGLWH